MSKHYSSRAWHIGLTRRSKYKYYFHFMLIKQYFQGLGSLTQHQERWPKVNSKCAEKIDQITQPWSLYVAALRGEKEITTFIGCESNYLSKLTSWCKWSPLIIDTKLRKVTKSKFKICEKFSFKYHTNLKFDYSHDIRKYMLTFNNPAVKKSQLSLVAKIQNDLLNKLISH